MLEDFLRTFPRYKPAQSSHSCPLKIGNTSKFLQQFLRGPCPHSRNILKRCFRLTLAAPLPVEGDGEPVSLVSDLLNQMEHGRMTLQNEGFVLLAQDVEDLLLFCDA